MSVFAWSENLCWYARWLAKQVHFFPWLVDSKGVSTNQPWSSTSVSKRYCVGGLSNLIKLIRVLGKILCLERCHRIMRWYERWVRPYRSPFLSRGLWLIMSNRVRHSSVTSEAEFDSIDTILILLIALWLPMHAKFIVQCFGLLHSFHDVCMISVDFM